MKSDISRQTFDSRKHYSRVLMQQGRVQLDADWNEQQDILLHRFETQTSDMIAPSGVSADSNGFELTYTPDRTDLLISPGYLYVDGILCELEQEMAVAVQSIKAGRIQISLAEIDNPPSPQAKLEEADNPLFQKGRWVELLDENEQRSRLLKITDMKVDRDKQIMTLSTDQSDFNLSDKNARMLKVRPVMTYLTQLNYPQPAERTAWIESPDATHVFLAYLDVWQRQITPFDDPDIREVALGGADTSHRSQTLWQVKIEPVEITYKELLEAIKQDTGKLPGEQRNQLERWMNRLLRISTFGPELSKWKAPEHPDTGKLGVHITSINGSDTPNYRGIENQLYHVEIHQGNVDGSTPIYKWARNNASSLVAAKIENGVVTIQGSGQGSLLGLKVGQFVELLDEQTELLGLSGNLAQIKKVDDITGQLTLEPPPTDNSQGTRLRLWDATDSFNAGQNQAVSSSNWIPLEGGIEIQFTPGEYRTGDYWLIPARTATGEINWPHTIPQPPPGIQHHYARLACLLHSQTLWLQQDCRRRFFPLAADALHILDINWQNDILNPSSLLREGLLIFLDGEPDQESAGAMQAAMIVSVETALPGGGAGIFRISGHFEINANIIRWHWHREEKEGLLAKFFARFDDFRSDLFDTHGHYQRVRITLKGHYIWRTFNGRRIYLDGQTFGMPGTMPSGHIPTTKKEPGPHIDLQFPSGAGRPASDFESWFYIKE